MCKKYYFDVNENLKTLILECLDELQKLGFVVDGSIYFREGKGKSCYGTCGRGEWSNKYKKWDFVISVNKYLFDKNDIKETIIHELLHTVDITHGRKWKELADFINKNTSYKIERCSDRKLLPEAYAEKIIDKNDMIELTCPVCGDNILVKNNIVISNSGSSNYYCKKCNINYYKNIPDSPVKNYTPKQKEEFVENLCLNNIIDENFVLNTLPYLNQQLRNKLVLSLFKNNTELFLSEKSKQIFIYPVLNTCEKQVKDKIAKMFINDEVQRLTNMTEEEFICFSGLFSLTKNYLLVQAHWNQICNKTK